MNLIDFMMARRPELQFISLLQLSAQKREFQQQQHLPLPSKKRHSTSQQTIPSVLLALQKLANSALKKGPFSVTYTDFTPPSGDIHDFYSVAPYYWPVKLVVGPNGAEKEEEWYERRDGQRVPDSSFFPNQGQLEQLAECVTYLSLAFFFFEDDHYAHYAMKLLHIFFVETSTKMNPNVNCGQAIRGIGPNACPGRKEGIISTRALARIANVIPILVSSKFLDGEFTSALTTWYTDYLSWLVGSPLGHAELESANNHRTWYLVQTCTILWYLGRFDEAVNYLDQFFTITWPLQLDPLTGDQPQESCRTRPFHYLIFNLQAVVFLAQIGDELKKDYWQLCDHGIKKTLDFVVRLWCEDSVNGLSCIKKEKTADLTELLDCLLILQRKYKDQHGEYMAMIREARTGPNCNKITGPKHQIKILWAPEEYNE